MSLLSVLPANVFAVMLEVALTWLQRQLIFSRTDLRFQTWTRALIAKEECTCVIWLEGKLLRKCTMAAISKDYVALSVNQAAMQECFLKLLLANKQEKTEDFDEMSILKFGVEVTGYEENDEMESVMVELSNRSNIVGSVLLGCDGIHLAVCQSMMTSLPAPVKDDPLHFCNTV